MLCAVYIVHIAYNHKPMFKVLVKTIVKPLMRFVVVLFWSKKHDDVLEKKGPFGENWRTSSKPFDQRRVNSLYGAGRSPKQTKRMTDTLLGPYGLATRGTPDWVELEVFSKLCRGERLRVRNRKIFI